MSLAAATTSVRAAPERNGPLDPGADLLRTFNALRDELLSTLLFMLGNRDDAHDVAQETFLKCWRARATVVGVENLRAWIFRVGINAARDLQRNAWNRRAKPLVGEDVMLVDHAAPPDKRAEEQDCLNRVRTALLQLRQEEKEIFLLRQNGGLTYEQIAEIRNSPVGTVKTQMRAALQKLRRVLAPQCGT